MSTTSVTFDILARDRASATFNRIGRNTDSLNRRLGSLARTARVALGGFAAFEAGRAVKAIASLGIAYQDSLNVFQSVTRATGGQMDQVAQKAKQLGANLKLPTTSAADAAAAMTELAKGGLNVRQSMQAALGTLQLATAAQVDGATAAKIQSAALAQFGLGARKAGHVADLLANAANAAQGEITDMATALTYVGPIAARAGISIDDTSTAISVLAKNGILAQKAGTSLRGLIVSLQKPTTDGAKALQALGVNAYDAQGRFVGLRKVVDQLHTAQGKFTQQGFGKALATAFGRQNLGGITALVSGGTKEFDHLAKAVERSGGAAQVAEARSKGLGGALRGLKSQLETVAISIYQRLAPSIERLVRNASTNLPDFIDKVKQAFVRARPDLETFGRNVKSIGKAFFNALKTMKPFAQFVATTLVDATRVVSRLLGKLGDMPGTVKTLTRMVVLGAAAWKGYTFWVKAAAIWSARFGGTKTASGGGAGGAAVNGGIFGAVAALTGKVVRMVSALRAARAGWLALGRAVSLAGPSMVGGQQDMVPSDQALQHVLDLTIKRYADEVQKLKTATGASREHLLALKALDAETLISSNIITVNGRVIEEYGSRIGGLPALYAAAVQGARDFAAAIGGGGEPKSPYRDPGHPGYVPPGTDTANKAADAGKKKSDQYGNKSLNLGKDAASQVAKGLSAGASKAISAAKAMVDKIQQQFQQLRDKARQLAQSIRQAMTGAADLSNLSQTDSLGAAFAPTIQGIKSFLDQQLTSDRQFRRLLKQERARGLSQALYRQLAEAGPSALPIVQALAGASRAELRDISRTNRQIGLVGGGLGRSVSQDVYGQALREQSRLQRESRDLLKQLIRTVKDDDHFTESDARRVGREFRRAIHHEKVTLNLTDVDKAQGRRVQAG